MYVYIYIYAIFPSAIHVLRNIGILPQQHMVSQTRNVDPNIKKEFDVFQIRVQTIS
jgi:hypothetical protein